ncbi:aminotransferase class V-fold PLP-dependent enzyme [Halovenus salina]|uniref:aminotransferase class V-fold PLP-dependent enzyme n=1 Tax=Halovenus salina TaxID=1510225 RepID=UPI002260A11D|nr:aminotransferase class V-fold PLP-dependent enzyme [Halovenus salina]
MSEDTARPTTPMALRDAMPAFEKGRYFNFGAHGPSPRHVVKSAENETQAHEYEVPVTDDPYKWAFERFDDARERLATFLGVEGDEVALTESTTAGITAIAGAIDWEPGDVIVRTDLEHPAGVLPWQRLEAEGVEVRVVETEAGRIDVDAFTEAVADAKLACFSALTWTHGTMLPVEELVDIAHEAGAFTLVDAVQVPGQRPMDVTAWGADAVAAAGHKWLLGAWGAGFLYVDREAAAELSPRAVGYRSVEDPTGDDLAFAAGARRFEVGTTSLAPYAALSEAIETIESVGIEEIHDRSTRLAGRLAEAIPTDRLLSPADPESGLVAVDVDDPEATTERLAEDGLIVRPLPEPAAVRASIHAVNTEEDVDRLAAALESEWA